MTLSVQGFLGSGLSARVLAREVSASELGSKLSARPDVPCERSMQEFLGSELSTRVLATEVPASKLGSELTARPDGESVEQRSKSLNMGRSAWELANREVSVRQNQGCEMFVDDSFGKERQAGTVLIEV